MVEDHASRLSSRINETVSLLQAAGRVLAEPVAADRDIPPFPRSTRDGYAVRAADLAKLPAKLKVIGEIKAGPGRTSIRTESRRSILHHDGRSGAAGRRRRSHGRIHIAKRRPGRNRKRRCPGENIVAQGAEAKRGSLLLDRGTRLNEAAIALAASVGRSRLEVYMRPRVAVLTTGDEIVAVDAKPGPTQIRNSNSYSLAVQIQQAGGDPCCCPSLPTNRAACAS